MPGVTGPSRKLVWLYHNKHKREWSEINFMWGLVRHHKDCYFAESKLGKSWRFLSQGVTLYFQS